MLLIVLLAIHLLAAVFWVGGMAFAYTVLRPSAAARRLSSAYNASGMRSVVRFICKSISFLERSRE